MLAYQICAPINGKRSATVIDFLNGAAISKPSTDVSNVQRWFSKWNFLMKLFRICKFSCILRIQYICKYFMLFLIGGMEDLRMKVVLFQSSLLFLSLMILVLHLDAKVCQKRYKNTSISMKILAIQTKRKVI